MISQGPVFIHVLLSSLAVFCSLAQIRGEVYSIASALKRCLKRNIFFFFPRDSESSSPRTGWERWVCIYGERLCAAEGKQGKAAVPCAWPPGRGEASQVWFLGDFFPGSAWGSLMVTEGSVQCSHGSITGNTMGVHGCCIHFIIGLLFLPVQLLESSWLLRLLCFLLCPEQLATLELTIMPIKPY